MEQSFAWGQQRGFRASIYRGSTARQDGFVGNFVNDFGTYRNHGTIPSGLFVTEVFYLC